MAPPGYEIEVNVISIDTEENYDFLSIYSGLAMTSQALVRSLSGHSETKQTVVVPNNTATISFVSDHSGDGEGFTIILYFRPPGIHLRKYMRVRVCMCACLR